MQTRVLQLTIATVFIVAGTAKLFGSKPWDGQETLVWELVSESRWRYYLFGAAELLFGMLVLVRTYPLVACPVGAVVTVILLVYALVALPEAARTRPCGCVGGGVGAESSGLIILSLRALLVAVSLMVLFVAEYRDMRRMRSTPVDSGPTEPA